MCWIVFNTVPHLTLLLHSIFGPGGFLVAWCALSNVLYVAFCDSQ